LAKFSNRGHKLAKVITKRFIFAARVVNHQQGRQSRSTDG
jgi:hypothetical protein